MSHFGRRDEMRESTTDWSSDPSSFSRTTLSNMATWPSLLIVIKIAHVSINHRVRRRGQSTSTITNTILLALTKIEVDERGQS